jgi:all-trans-8'-apo-beta-carotenal 15,15'-oxygenase
MTALRIHPVARVCDAPHADPVVSHPGQEIPYAAAPYAGLTTSLTEELDQALRVEGRLPEALRGTLYINGPGLFDRGGRRKHSALDGDGLVVAFVLKGPAPRVLAKFVQTDKYREEARAGRFLYATWTTRRTGGFLRNLGGRLHPRGQAGVTAMRWDDRLFAFDESVQPWEIDPQTLDTVGYAPLGLGEGQIRHSAHPKIDPVTREWIHFGTDYARRTQLHLTTFGEGMALRSHRLLPVDGAPYMHDFAVSAGHVVFIRHPVEVGLLKLIAGLSSIKDGMRWHPERGNQLLLLDRAGSDTKPLVLETDAAWVWHTLNAHDRGSETIVDFVGYEAPDHFLGREALLSGVMLGKPESSMSIGSPGKIRRYVIDRAARRVREEIVDPSHHDFPFVDPRRSTRRHRFGYFVAASRGGGWLTSAIERVDMDTGKTARHDFGEAQYCLEPVFVPRPGPFADEPGAQEPGWLLTLVYDGRANTSRLVVLDAEDLPGGPIAQLHVDRPLPFRFHGTWWPAA